MLGSVASIRIGRGTGLQFGWHWSIIAVALAVFLWNWKFWNAVWHLQENPTPQARQKLAVHLGILVLLGLGCFLYPIRFVEQTYETGISAGLVTALAFLGTMVWLLFKCGKGLLEIDDRELERVKTTNHN